MGRRAVLALIPAKGTSRRLARKNLRDLCGLPLVGWAVRAARESGLFPDDHIVVDSEDEEILAYGRSLAVDTLRRPPRLAEDGATLVDVIAHAIRELETDEPLSVLLPTSPLRNPATMRWAALHHRDRKAGTLLSVTPTQPQCWGLAYHRGDVWPVCPQNFNVPRDQVPETYRHDGSHCLIRPGQPGTGGFIVDPREAVDVDTALDLAYAEFLVREHRIPWLTPQAPARPSSPRT